MRLFFLSLLLGLFSLSLGGCASTPLDTTAPRLVFVNPTDMTEPPSDATAVVVDGADDLEYVEIVWRPLRGDTQNLADSDLSSPNGLRWEFGPWDFRRELAPGFDYELAVVGVDSLGNVDQNPDILRFNYK